jgi:hypothetical protein
MRSTRALWAPLLVLALAAVCGCRQTRPLPAYEPLLALEANRPQPASASSSEMYRPAWSGPKPAPRKGGG